jgi:archaellum biogenesis ATPase FlaH
MMAMGKIEPDFRQTRGAEMIAENDNTRSAATDRALNTDNEIIGESQMHNNSNTNTSEMQPILYLEKDAEATKAKQICSVFAAPVKNTINFVNVSWEELFDRLTTPNPTILTDNSPKEKADNGAYFVRGVIEDKRKDSNLGQCSLVIIDVDKSLEGEPLPQPDEIHKALKGIRHAVHSTASPGRCRIVAPVKPYDKSETDRITLSFYHFCQERGLHFAFAAESGTKSQPWFLPQTTDIKNHQAFGTLVGEMFHIGMIKDLHPAHEEEVIARDLCNVPESVDSPLGMFLDALASGTIHEAVKKYAGWKRRTTNLTMKQIFDDIEILIDANCSDLAKVKRWHESERKGLEDWFRDNVGEGGVKKFSPTDSAIDILKVFEVTEDYVNGLGKEKWLFPNLIIASHLVVIIALAGGGKTTIFFNYVVPYMVNQGAKVFYIDADNPASEHKKMKTFVDEIGFTLLNPNVIVGRGVDTFRQTLTEMVNSGTDLSGHVFIFDTLKKFTDLMSKSDVKDFLTLCRTMNNRGATCIFLAHANKFRDKNENLIPEGVGDVKNDVDDLIFFERVKKPGGIDVTTLVDVDKGAKTRGIFQPISFHIDTERKVSMYENALALPKLIDKSNQKATGEEILDIAEEILLEANEPVAKTDLIKMVYRAAGGLASEQRINNALTQNSALKGAKSGQWMRFLYTKGDRNSILFTCGKNK